ncbi:hypothetical protein BJ165DRAFT_910500 [Panaeolus papilionaceus]|nr:hypothetical protein BJ165DRAFT_910500 [Panaeolus papilionaceus]
MYVPSESTPVGVDRDDLTVELGIWDSAVEYSTGWQDLEGMGRMAATMAAVRIRFYGTGVTWIGTLPSDQPRSSGRAQWQLDGGQQNNFTLSGSNGGTMRNRVLFGTPAMQRGHHTLIVTNLGQSNVMPLVLTRLWIHGGAIPEPVRPAGSDNSGDFTSTIVDQNPTSLPSGSGSNVDVASGSKDSEVPIGPIVGGVIGGLALIVGMVVALLWIRRQTRVENPDHVESQRIVPYEGRPSVKTRPSGVPSVASDDDETATQRTVVVSVNSEKKRKKKKALSEKQRLKMRNQPDTSSIATTDAQSVRDKESVKMVEVVPVPLAPNRFTPNRRQEEPPSPPPPAMPAIPEQRAYSPGPLKKGFGIGRNRSKTPPVTAAADLPSIPSPSSPPERYLLSPSTYSSPVSPDTSSVAGSNSSTIAPLFRPNRRPVTGSPAPPQQEAPITHSEAISSVAASKQRARTPSPPPMERHTSVSTYSRPPSTNSPLTGMRNFWRSNRRTMNSETTNGDEGPKHASVSTYAHPPSDVGGYDAGMAASETSNAQIRPNRRDTVNTHLSLSTFSGTPTLVEESTSEPTNHGTESSHTLAPLRPVRHPILESNPPSNALTSPGVMSPALSKQEEVAREAEAVANFTSRFRSRPRASPSTTGDRGKRKKHKDAGVVLVPPVFTGSTTAPKALGSPPGYSPPPS